MATFVRSRPRECARVPLDRENDRTLLRVADIGRDGPARPSELQRLGRSMTVFPSRIIRGASRSDTVAEKPWSVPGFLGETASGVLIPPASMAARASGSSESLTGMLQAWAKGDLDARDRLLPIVYGELRKQAARQLKSERVGHTLQPTALVHEVYLRLAQPRRVPWESRAEFFAAAARAMRRILVDHARKRGAAKRAGEWTRVELPDGVADVGGKRDPDLLALDAAVDRLAELDPRHARIVELRFFGGLSVAETAHVLGVSTATVKRDWSLARAWLHRRLER